jgi:hypothetical protein
MMREAFIVQANDINRLMSNLLKQPVSNSIICSAVSQIAELKESSRVYFVISKIAMSSTAYQELALSAFTATKESDRWLIFLDDVPIPLGFGPLRSLPRL